MEGRDGGTGEEAASVSAPPTVPTDEMATFANRTAEFLLCMQQLAAGSNKSLPAIMTDLITRGPALKIAVTHSLSSLANQPLPRRRSAASVL